MHVTSSDNKIDKKSLVRILQCSREQQPASLIRLASLIQSSCHRTPASLLAIGTCL